MYLGILIMKPHNYKKKKKQKHAMDPFYLDL